MKEAQFSEMLKNKEIKYAILGAPQLEQLEVIVRQAMKAGFATTGGPFHSPTTPGKDNFFQAVVR